MVRFCETPLIRIQANPYIFSNIIWTDEAKLSKEGNIDISADKNPRTINFLDRNQEALGIKRMDLIPAYSGDGLDI